MFIIFSYFIRVPFFELYIHVIRSQKKRNLSMMMIKMTTKRKTHSPACSSFILRSTEFEMDQNVRQSYLRSITFFYISICVVNAVNTQPCRSGQPSHDAGKKPDIQFFDLSRSILFFMMFQSTGGYTYVFNKLPKGQQKISILFTNKQAFGQVLVVGRVSKIHYITTGIFKFNYIVLNFNKIVCCHCPMVRVMLLALFFANNTLCFQFRLKAQLNCFFQQQTMKRDRFSRYSQNAGGFQRNTFE